MRPQEELLPQFRTSPCYWTKVPNNVPHAFFATIAEMSPVARMKVCDTCGHEEFSHLYQTQICTVRNCRCDGWKEPGYEQHPMLEAYTGYYE